MSKKEILFFILAVIIGIPISFSITALFVKIICWAFGFNFTFKMAIGIWALIFLINSAFRVKTPHD